MIAAKFGDPVIGIDIHAVIAPPPVVPPGPPTPLPHPFVGVVYDPLGAAIGAALGLATGGGAVLVNLMPAGNTGTTIKGQPHVPTPPGVGPHPIDAPTKNEGTLITGSKTVLFGGCSESRTASFANSCSYPLNLPTSVCLAVPMGPPVLVGGPEAVDWAAAAMSAIRTKWMSEQLHTLLGANAGSWKSKLICFLTGHPVDVMTGELIAEAVDFEVPGLIPIRWERNYRSRQTREGAMGPGWAHPFDDHVEETGSGVVVWQPDGRPNTHRRLRLGESDWHAEDRYTLRRVESGYEIRSWDGIRRLYSRVEGNARFVLTEVRDRASNRVLLAYERGYLVQIVDTAGRELKIAWTSRGRIEGVYFEGAPLVRYAYDDEDRLAAAIDPLGHAMRYDYAGGVLVKETHKSGMKFRFEWDWLHPEGYCVRTWGENPDAIGRSDEGAGVPRYVYDRKITYLPERRYCAVEDGRGGVTQYWGNALNLVDKEIDPSGNARLYEWNADARKTSETDPEGNRTEWDYDERGNCILERGAAGVEIQKRYDEENRLREIVDGAGGRWTVDWDPRGGPSAVTNPLGVATRYLQDDRGRLVEVIDPMGRSARLLWNERNDVETVRFGASREVHYEHDSLGRLTATEDADGRKTRAVLDARGDIVQVVCLDGDRLTLGYDAEGNVVEQVDASGRRVRMRYEGLRRLVERVDPMNHRVRLRYDVEETVIAVENEGGESYRFELDEAGRVVRELGFDGKIHRYLYDKAGRPARILAPDHLVTVLDRDPLGRVVKRTTQGPPGPHDDAGVLRRVEEEVFVFDARGDIVEARRGEAHVVLERDALRRIVREVHRNADEDARAVDSRYDYSNLRVERETSLGHSAHYEYDSAGELEDLRLGSSALLRSPELRSLALSPLQLPSWEMKIQRDPMGLELGRRMPGGVVAIWRRDPFGRPALREVLRGAFPEHESETISRIGYRWSKEHRIDALIDTRLGATTFDYDLRGHLVAATFADGSVQHRASDEVSNVFTTADRSDRRYGRGGVLEHANGADYRYDGRGNLVEKVLADGARWKYSWAPDGHLASVVRPDGKRVCFDYDVFGRRVRKSFDGSVTEYVWDGETLVHERRSKDGVLEPLLTWVFEPSTRAPVAKVEGKNRYSIVCDHIGTPMSLFTEAGHLAWKAQLDLYGVPREQLSEVAPENATKNPWRFAGQYEDEETGLYYNRHRYYDPELGRYLSPDPKVLNGGLPQYAYVHDPLSFIDPEGLKKCSFNEDALDKLGDKPEGLLNPHRHHIVMEGLFSHWGEEKRAFVTGARDILEKHGIDLQGPLNACWAENAGHSADYAEKVYNDLKAVEGQGAAAVKQELERIGGLISKGKYI